MPTLDQTPANNSLLALTPVWGVSVVGITAGTAARTLTVTRSGVGVIYSWVNGVVTSDPSVTTSYTYDGNNLVVTLALAAPAGQGEEFSFSTAYTDSATSLSLSRNYIAGEVSVLTQSPVPHTVDVSVSSSVLFNLATTAPLVITGATLSVDGAAAYDSAGGFSRPDFEGNEVFTYPLLALNVKGRRRFNSNTSVPVSVKVTFSGGGMLLAEKNYDWTFTTTYIRTVVADSALLFTTVDQPSPRGLIEAFRTALIAGLKPEGSTASTAVLMFYAVQRSGLSSLAPYLPGAGLLAPEVSRLQRQDFVVPEDAYQALLPVEAFFETFLRELVVIGQALTEEAELLLRAWESGDPQNRVATVAAALLYALPVAG